MGQKSAAWNLAVRFLGSTYISPWNRRAYRTGYPLMICGVVTSLVFAAVWHAR